jgi:hypothetical protein
MKLDISRIDLLFVGLGVTAWAVALAVIWFRRTDDPRIHREGDFLQWKHLENRPHATFAEFLASEQASRSYLSKPEKSIVATLLAALALYSALRNWGVFT